MKIVKNEILAANGLLYRLRPPHALYACVVVSLILMSVLDLMPGTAVRTTNGIQASSPPEVTFLKY